MLTRQEVQFMLTASGFHAPMPEDIDGSERYVIFDVRPSTVRRAVCVGLTLRRGYLDEA